MFTSEFDNVLFALIGHKSNPSSVQSNLQRYFSRFCILLCVLLLIEALVANSGFRQSDVPIYIAVFVTIMSATLFYWVILLPPFVHRSELNALRLLGNTILSTLFMILVFSLWYRIFGIEPEGTPLDAIYFSAVTFSTLGFGDFNPMPKAQIFAALQALLGNLHLGFIVGATLFATSQSPSTK